MKVRFFGIGMIVVGLTATARADIVGGEPVEARDPVAATTAALYTPSPNGKGGSLCTASVIGRDRAITAAHCVADAKSNPVLIFGRRVDDPNASARRVTGVRVHHDWKKKQGSGADEGDIAIVGFGGGVPAGYRPAPLARRSEPDAGEGVILAGYGIDDARTRTGSGRLRRTTVRVADPRPGASEMILDQSHGHGACHGDSGGPAFSREGGRTVLAGVTNRSYPASAPDDCAHRVVYTKVGANRDWIRRASADLKRRGGSGEFAAPVARAPAARPRRARAGNAKPKVWASDSGAKLKSVSKPKSESKPKSPGRVRRKVMRRSKRDPKHGPKRSSGRGASGISLSKWGGWSPLAVLVS